MAIRGRSYPARPIIKGALIAPLTPTLITPGGGTIAVMGAAPTVTVTANLAVVPGGGVLAVMGAAPTVTATANVNLTPGAGSLAVASSAPTATVTANKVLTPSGAAVAVIGFAPTVTVTSSVVITPDAGTIAVTTSPPNVLTSGNKLYAPGAGTVALISSAPTILTPKTVTPGAGSLAVAGAAPTLTLSANKLLQPGATPVAVVGFAPQVAVTANAVIVPGTAPIALTGYPPTMGSNKILTPGAFTMALTGYAPLEVVAPPAVNFVDYGWCQSELPWGAASPVPMTVEKQRGILQGIKAIGGSRVRVGVQVGTWADLDLTVNLAVEAGLKPLLVIMGNATLGYNGSVSSYAALCKAVATRYMDRVDNYELFNEANNVFFNEPKQAAAGFAAYIKAGYTAIKAVQPSAFVMPAGTVPTYDVAFGWAQNPVDWYKALYAAGCRDFMDGIAFHLYCEEPPTPAVRQWKYMLDIRDLMVAQGDGAKKVFVTEVGTSYPGPGITDTIMERDWLKIMVEAIIAYPWCSVFWVYNFQNSSNNTTDSTGSNYGIRTYDGAPKEPKYSYAATISATPVDPGDIAPPSPPTSAACALTTTTTASVTWMPATDDVGVTVYKVYDADTGRVLGQTSQIGQVSLLLENLVPSTGYTGYVTAFDAAGHESPHSNTFLFHTAAPVGVQQAYTYDMTGSPPVPLVFTQLDDGFVVTSGVARPNTPTVDKLYWSCQPYTRALQTPDHYAEIEVDAIALAADRSAIAWVRVSADGSQRIGGRIAGGGQVDSCEIFTYINGEVKVRAAINAAALLSGGVEKLRITADGATYTASRVKDGVVTDIGNPWVDVNNEYPGGANLLTAIGWEYLRVKGVYYPPQGITKFHAADLRATQPSVGVGGASWTFAVVKTSKRGLVKASQRWQTALK